jgi:hypothetical protein
MNVNILNIYGSAGCYTLIISSVQPAQVLDFDSTKLCIVSNWEQYEVYGETIQNDYYAYFVRT